MNAVPWPPTDWVTPAVMLTGTVLFTVYHYFGRAEAIVVRLRGGDNPMRQAKSVVLQRVSGAVLLGLVPLVLAAGLFDLSPSDLGCRLGDIGVSLAWIGTTLVLILPTVVLSARRPSHWTMYPQIRSERWDARLKSRNLASWTVYLVGYEFFFRGFWLVPLVDAFGFWAGLTVMTALYTFAHIHKDAGETIGCIAMGMVFGLAALTSGSLLAPIVIHVVIANTSDLVAIKTGGSNAIASSS